MADNLVSLHPSLATYCLQLLLLCAADSFETSYPSVLIPSQPWCGFKHAPLVGPTVTVLADAASKLEPVIQGENIVLAFFPRVH